MKTIVAKTIASMKRQKENTKMKTEALEKITASADDIVRDIEVSTARYWPFDSRGTELGRHIAVCFNSIHSYVGNYPGFGIAFQGYGGFIDGKRWRDAKEYDLHPHLKYPFFAHGYSDKNYNEVSLQWLKCLLDEQGPFASILPALLETDAEDVQRRKAFIFPDSSRVPSKLTWCFAIASRMGFANARVVWRYIHLLEKGVDSVTALLVASGFEAQIDPVKKEPTGKLIKSYTGGFLGVDVSAYAGRFLTCKPYSNYGLGAHQFGTYKSSDVFLSGKIDMKNIIFDNWDEVIKYVQMRGREQTGLEEAA